MVNFIKQFLKQKSGSSFFLLQFNTYLFFVSVILIAYFFPQFFTSWISDINIFIISSISFLVLNTILTVFSYLVKSTSSFRHTGALWIIWYFLLILLSGGINSSFTFAMIFVPVISVSFLDLKLARNLCILSVVLLTAVILFENINTLSLSSIILHIVHVWGYSMLVFVVYKFVKNILYHRYREEEAKRKFLELEEIENVKKIFLTAMSHQLRTPLAATKWALEIMLSNKEKFDPNLLRAGYERVNQSLAIIGDILRTAELEVNPKIVRIKKAPVLLDRFLSSIIDDLSYLAENKKVEVVHNKIGETYISADEKMLGLAVSSVIDNAIRYSPGGKVTINSKPEGNKIQIAVKDTGIGIDSADFEYIFQKFYRGKNAMLIDPNESGIGLYAARKIIELHGGQISLDSALNKGTTVTITLPLTGTR